MYKRLPRISGGFEDKVEGLKLWRIILPIKLELPLNTYRLYWLYHETKKFYQNLRKLEDTSWMFSLRYKQKILQRMNSYDPSVPLTFG